MPLIIGQQLDGNRYTVLAKLGQGGAGSVYKVQDNRAVPGMPVTLALKEISVSAILDPLDREENAAAFRSEVRLLMSLNHPYLTQVVNFFAEGYNYYLVMDFVDGKTLLKALEEADGPLPVSSVLDWFWQLCDVLVYLHGLDQPIIFRDLKPGNIMVTRQQGTVKLIDFGIARFFKKDSAADTRALGTPGYAPPEQYGRSQTDERSDIYSLGVTIYELLTNINPDEHIFNLPPALTLNPAIPPALAAMLVKMTQLEPEARYQTMVEVRSDLAKLYPKPAHPTPAQTLRVLAGQQPPLTPPSAVVTRRGTAPRAAYPPSAPPDGRGANTPQPTRTIPGLDERYLATPPPLPAQRKLSVAPAQPVRPVPTSPPQHPITLQANNLKPRASATRPYRNSKLITIILALLLVGVIIGGSYFGLLPFSLPFIGTASHAPAPDTLYPATVAAPPGVTNPTLNSRSPRGQWWMSGYDWGGTNFSHESGPIIAGTSLWSYPISMPNYAPSNLIVASEGYYLITPGQTVTSPGSITLYLDSSGQPAWSFDLPAAAPQAPTRLAYARAGNAAFLYLQDGSGQIYASDPAAQGRSTWRFDLGQPSPYAPVVANGVLYATSPLTLTALDAATGKQLWQDNGPFATPPLLSPDAASINVVQSGKLTALNPTDGKAKWQSKDTLPAPTNAAYPLLATADTIYLGAPGGAIISFDATTGDQLSQFSVGGPIVALAVAGNTLFVAVAGPNSMTARDTASGFERWTYPLSGNPVGAPIIVGDTLYILSGDSKLTILNTRSGALLKSITVPDAPLGEAAYANATFYYFGEKGLHAIH
jgi:serine/threonine protein kinase/outer membrane protein assembly factor BamB